MNFEDERRIHRLLLQREREFTAVWRAECEINKILGAKYTFAEPPDLPSLYKPNRSSRKKIAKKAKIPKLASLIRNLNPEEEAYLVTYASDGKESSVLQIDNKFIRQIVPISTNSFKMKAVHTVKLNENASYEIIERLWNEGDKFNL